MSKYGCPYRIDDYCNDLCPIIKKSVEGFVMCEVDWESCPEYQAQHASEAAEYAEYIKQLKANGFTEV